MRTSPEEFLIERIFNKKYGDAFGGSLSVEAAYEQLKEISGEDFGWCEALWRAWLAAWKQKLSARIRSGQILDELA